MGLDLATGTLGERTGEAFGCGLGQDPVPFDQVDRGRLPGAGPLDQPVDGISQAQSSSSGTRRPFSIFSWISTV